MNMDNPIVYKMSSEPGPKPVVGLLAVAFVAICFAMMFAIVDALAGVQP